MAEGNKNKSVDKNMYTIGDIVHYKNEYSDKVGIVVDTQCVTPNTTDLPRILLMFQENGNPTHWFAIDKTSEDYLTNLSH
jgi:hypothetical protein